MKLALDSCVALKWSLPEREQCQLVTADQRLVNLQPTFPFVVDLAQLL